jgi:hypothetical protein
MMIQLPKSSVNGMKSCPLEQCVSDTVFDRPGTLLPPRFAARSSRRSDNPEMDASVSQGDRWQWHEAIPIAFGVAHVNALARGITVTDLQGQSFTQAKAHAVLGEVEDPVAQGAGGPKQGLRFIDGDDSGRREALMKWGIAHGLPSTRWV